MKLWWSALTHEVSSSLKVCEILSLCFYQMCAWQSHSNILYPTKVKIKVKVPIHAANDIKHNIQHNWVNIKRLCFCNLTKMWTSFISCLSFNFRMVGPCIQCVFISTRWLQRLWSVLLDVIVRPLFRSISRCCGGFSIHLSEEWPSRMISFL